MFLLTMILFIPFSINQWFQINYTKHSFATIISIYIVICMQISFDHHYLNSFFTAPHSNFFFFLSHYKSLYNASFFFNFHSLPFLFRIREIIIICHLVVIVVSLPKKKNIQQSLVVPLNLLLVIEIYPLHQLRSLLKNRTGKHQLTTSCKNICC